jgi:hypothetical protein
MRVDEMDELHRIAGMFRSHPEYQMPPAFVDALRGALASGQYAMRPVSDPDYEYEA